MIHFEAIYVQIQPLVCNDVAMDHAGQAEQDQNIGKMIFSIPDRSIS